MKKLLTLLLSLPFSCLSNAQSSCTLKPPMYTIHFGSGLVRDLNVSEPQNYSRVGGSCPTDGHYTYTSYTSDCFRGDWLTLAEDHTPGDVDGNMMVVNASYGSGQFLTTSVRGFKSGSTYEFGAWLMNVCRISKKCPSPLLPDIAIRLQTPSGKTVAQFRTGDLVRHHAPHWTQYRARFTVPPSESVLVLTMEDNRPGGCGNDFALDDITFRECVPTPPKMTPAERVQAAKQPLSKPVVKKTAPKKETPPPARTAVPVQTVVRTGEALPVKAVPALRSIPAFPPPPPALTSRTNSLVKRFETGGEIRLDLYDNGEIDGDTVSIYHNNTLLVRQARLSLKPITVRFTVDAEHPHHELVMVAENLGSIPPNTSLMIVTAGSERYQVHISSTETKNAKVVFDLKQ